MASKPRTPHREAIALLRLITNRTRDLIKTTEWKVWASNTQALAHVKHPANDLNYWRFVRDAAEVSMIYAEQLRTLACDQIERLEA